MFCDEDTHFCVCNYIYAGTVEFGVSHTYIHTYIHVYNNTWDQPPLSPTNVYMCMHTADGGSVSLWNELSTFSEPRLLGGVELNVQVCLSVSVTHDTPFRELLTHVKSSVTPGSFFFLNRVPKRWGRKGALMNRCGFGSPKSGYGSIQRTSINPGMGVEATYRFRNCMHMHMHIHMHIRIHMHIHIRNRSTSFLLWA
jgi:hypothetical protein